MHKPLRRIRLFIASCTRKIIWLLVIIIWLVFVGDITRALIGYFLLNCRVLFSRNAYGLITGLQKQSKWVNFITRTSYNWFQDKSDLTEINYERLGERENERNSQEEVETFVRKQTSENTTKETVSDISTLFVIKLWRK